MTPRITFGMIVLNGEPFTRYNLRTIYRFAHQIIVVEGACRAASAVAKPDGHSADGTLELLRRFVAEEDPEKKLVIVNAEDEGYPDGFWPEKNEMCWAYSRRASGDYLWQVDSDEFYKREDMEKIRDLLVQGVDAVSFPTVHFFGGLGYKVNGFRLLCDRYSEYHRVFKWGAKYRYLTHRPPTVVDESGVDVKTKKWINADKVARMGIHMYHYCFLFPHQVIKKANYYSTNSESKIRLQEGYIANADCWAEEVYMQLARPYEMMLHHRSKSWLERYQNSHPEEIVRMMAAIQAGQISVKMRQTDDIEKLLKRRRYLAACFILERLAILMSNPLGRFLRNYSLAFVRYTREGTLKKHAAQYCRNLFRVASRY